MSVRNTNLFCICQNIRFDPVQSLLNAEMFNWLPCNATIDRFCHPNTSPEQHGRNVTCTGFTCDSAQPEVAHIPGGGRYLDNLVAQISTPVLERLSLTLFFDLTFTLVNLTGFNHRTEGFECLVAKFGFGKDGASIDAGRGLHKQQGIGKLSLKVKNCEPFDWKIDSSAPLAVSFPL